MEKVATSASEQTFSFSTSLIIIITIVADVADHVDDAAFGCSSPSRFKSFADAFIQCLIRFSLFVDRTARCGVLTQNVVPSGKSKGATRGTGAFFSPGERERQRHTAKAFGTH